MPLLPLLRGRLPVGCETWLVDSLTLDVPAVLLATSLGGAKADRGGEQLRFDLRHAIAGDGEGAVPHDQ